MTDVTLIDGTRTDGILTDETLIHERLIDEIGLDLGSATGEPIVIATGTPGHGTETAKQIEAEAGIGAMTEINMVVTVTATVLEVRSLLLEQRRDDYARNTRRPASERVSSSPAITSNSASSSIRNGAASDRRSPDAQTSPNARQQATASAKSTAAPIAPKPVPVSSALLDQSVQRGVETLCERLYWYMQRERADTKFKKTKADVDRCRPSMSEYGSAFEVLVSQKDAALQDRDKCCARVDTTDQKLQKVSQSVLAAMRREIAESIVKSGVLEPGNGPDKAVTLSRSDFELERTSLNGQIAELRTQLLVEKARNGNLEQRLERIEAQLVAGVPAKRQEPESGTEDKVATMVGEAVKDLVTRDQLNHAVQELDVRLSASDMTQSDQSSILHASAGEKTGRKLASMEKFIQGLYSNVPTEGSNELPACIRSLMASVNGQERAIQEQAEHREATQSAIEELKRSANGQEQTEYRRATESAIEELKRSVNGQERAIQEQAEHREATQSAIEELKRSASGQERAIQEQTEHRLATESAIKELRRSASGQEQTEYRLATDSAIEELKKSVNNQERAIQEQVEYRQATESALEKMRGSVIKVGEDPSASETPRQSVLDFPSIDALESFILTTSKEPLKVLSTNLGRFLDTERNERIKIASETQETASSLLRLETEYGGLVKTQEERHSGLISDLALLGEKLGTVDSSLTAVKDDSSSCFDELQLQIRSMQGWQNNFTTRQLHEAILREMNKLVPNGLNSIMQLTSRIESMEGWLRSEESYGAKRRKTEHEGPYPSNGHVTT
ncbi:hypothetical protein Purlil1_807 [Purpureocillium lilacinum]|uniref:Uncharacterized protein n=1 Tax=Purpureocillium lilacinum TaxID=33203 RepID=A0ABR0CFD9_PURLI|nr:hypothetical protein Purlil1_807 [Purpureocillium lilacinum]